MFLNYVAPFIHSPPTKNMLFLYNPEETDKSKRLQEIKTKGTCSKKLIDYGIKEGSIIAMKQFMDNENANNIYDEVAKIFDLPSS